MEELKKIGMDKALSKVHEVFSKYAQDLPRFLFLKQGRDAK